MIQSRKTVKQIGNFCGNELAANISNFSILVALIFVFVRKYLLPLVAKGSGCVTHKHKQLNQILYKTIAFFMLRFSGDGLRVLARISKMCVQNSNSKISPHPDLATYLFQMIIPTTFNSLLCQISQDGL